jgi:hypothetical protein
MSSSDFYTAETAFDTALGNEWCLEQLNSPYLVDACTSQLDELPSAFSDIFFGQSVAGYDLPKEFLHRSPEVLATAFTVGADVDAHSAQTPLSDCVSLRQATPTSSSCSDRSLDGPARILEYDSLSCVSTDVGPAPKRQMKKRGQPKLDPIACSVSGALAEDQCTTSIPHNMVERKYRQGLNAQLERLRRAVPTLLQSSDRDGIGQPKLSKSMVIAAAIDHIEMVTQERDILQKENNEISQYRKENIGSEGRRGPKKRRVDLAFGSATV